MHYALCSKAFLGSLYVICGLLSCEINKLISLSLRLHDLKLSELGSTTVDYSHKKQKKSINADIDFFIISNRTVY